MNRLAFALALAGDSKSIVKSGSILKVGDLAKEYDFTDVDGRQIPAYK